MSDYISRQAAIEALNETSRECFSLRDDYISVMSALFSVESKINAIHSADVVEVVRCKNCKWYKTNYSWNGKEYKVCVIEPYEPVRKGDDYCSRGGRKDG